MVEENTKTNSELGVQDGPESDWIEGLSTLGDWLMHCIKAGVGLPAPNSSWKHQILAEECAKWCNENLKDNVKYGHQAVRSWLRGSWPRRPEMFRQVFGLNQSPLDCERTGLRAALDKIIAEHREKTPKATEARRTVAGRENIVLFRGIDNGDFLDTMESAVLHEAQTYGYKVRLEKSSDCSDQELIRRQLDTVFRYDPKPAGIVLMHVNIKQDDIDAFVHKCGQEAITVCGLETLVNKPGYSVLQSNSEIVKKLLGKIKSDFGERNRGEDCEINLLAVINADRDFYPLRKRYESLREEKEKLEFKNLKMQFLNAKVLPEHLGFKDNNLALIKKALRSNKTDAVLATWHRFSDIAILAIRSLGLTDVMVYTIDLTDSEFSELSNPNGILAAAITADPCEMGRECVRIIRRRLTSGTSDVQSRTILPQLFDRASLSERRPNWLPKKRKK